MKKLFICAALLVAAICFTSCDKNKEKCWKVEYKIVGVETTVYIWVTEADLEATYGSYDGVKWTAVTAADASACLDKNGE